jgi:hypothetical protein
MIVELSTSWRSWATRPPIHVGVARQTQLHCPNSILCLAHPIKQHSGSELNTLAELGTSAKAALVSLLKHDECERGRDHPAGCTRDPSSSRTFPDRTAPCYRPCGVSSAITNLLRGLARSTATVFPMRTPGVVPGRHQAWNHRGRGSTPFGIVSEERWPVCRILEILDRVQGAFNVDARLVSPRQNHKAG